MSNDRTTDFLERAYEDAEVKIKITIELNDMELEYHPEIITAADDWYEKIGEVLAYKIDDTLRNEIYEQAMDNEPDYDMQVKYED